MSPAPQELNGRATGPVFVVGMNGSGTTMLLDCLNSHPALYGFPLETKILPYFMERLNNYGDLSIDENFRRLWDDLRNILWFRVVNDFTAPPLPDDWSARPRTFGAALDGVYRYFAEREGKRRWCEKSPMYSLYMDRFADIFPDAQFIHIIRDGRDCAASFHRRYGYTPKYTMYRWRTIVSQSRRVGRSLGDRYMELRYEELTSQPLKYMKRICDFLEEPYTDDLLRLGRERNEHKSLSPTIVPNSEKWQSYFSSREAHSLERIGGSLLAELGYQTDWPDGRHDPGPLALKYWRYKDHAKRTATLIAQMLKTNDSRKRQHMVERMFTNFRHSRTVGTR